VGQNLGQGKLVSCPSGGGYLNDLIRVEELLGDRVKFRSGAIFSKFLK